MSFRRCPALLAVLALAGSNLLTAQSVRLPQTPEQLAQEGGQLTPEAAATLEDQLKKEPLDLNSRSRLLGYYFYQWMQVGEDAAREARRRHVIWLIQTLPAHPAAAIYEAVLDPKGHSLADPEGYEQARQLWSGIIETSSSAPALGNAGRFLQLNDRDLAEKAFLKAQAIDPRNGEWAWRLGYLYGLAIMGVDALAFNGQPASIDPLAREGPFAAKAQKALETSSSPLMVAVAANVIARHGLILAPSEKVRVEHLVQAERLYRRAQELEPANPQWRQLLQQTQALRSQMESTDPSGRRRNQRN